MTVRSNQTLALTQSGFSEAQANALATTIERTAAGAVNDLRHDLEAWHVYLAMYLLIQISIVLLVLLFVQALREPAYRAVTGFAAPQTGLMSRPSSAIHGESPVNLTRFVTSQT